MGATTNVVRRLSDVDWDFTGYVPKSQGDGIHGLHWYPAPFPSALAATLIDILGPRESFFLDPFSGSGVGPIEAWFQGYRAIGVDSSHFATMLARAKVQLIERGTREVGLELVEAYLKARRSTIDYWRSMSQSEIFSAAGIHADADRWFTRSVMAEIACAKTFINSGNVPHEWRDVLTILLSSVLHRRFSIVRNYHYTYIVDRSKVGVEALADVNAAEILGTKIKSTFLRVSLIRDQLQRTRFAATKIPGPTFYHARAENLESLASEPVGLVVTSPPYFGMNDYVRSQYLSWLIFGWPGYERDLAAESGSRRDRRSRRALEEYVQAMETAFRGLYSAMQGGAHLAVVMGASSSRLSRESDIPARLSKAIEIQGFAPVWSGARRIRFRKINNTPYRSELIWVFKK